MNAAYRVIHFVTEPFLAGRVPVAALVQTASGVRLARADLLPDQQTLGRATATVALGAILDCLEHASGFDELPRGIGPHAILDAPHPIPPEVPDPIGWVRKVILPTRIDEAGSRDA